MPHETIVPEPATPTQALASVNPANSPSIHAFSSADAFAVAQRMAKALGSSSLVPQEYRDNIPNVMIAMDVAARIGASPFAVMQNIDIIHGRPSWRATFLIATVNACGRFSPLRFRFQGEPGKASWGCRAYARDREGGDMCEGALITLALAESEGWTKKSGSKWKTMPEQMLMYRAAAFWTRVYAPELSLGMYTRDEIEDMMPASEMPKVSRGPATAKPSSLAEKIASLPAQSESEPTVVYEEPEPDAHDSTPLGEDELDAVLG